MGSRELVLGLAKGGDKKIKTCQANLRTMDGAIETYAATNLTDPTGLRDPVPTFLKEVLKEPTTGLNYHVHVPGGRCYGSCTRCRRIWSHVLIVANDKLSI